MQHLGCNSLAGLDAPQVCGPGRSNECVSVVAATDGGIQDLAIYGGRVYWTSYALTTANNQYASVLTVALDGGSVATLAGSDDYYDALSASSAGIYWTDNGSGTVKSLPADGPPRTTTLPGVCEGNEWITPSSGGLVVSCGQPAGSGWQSLVEWLPLDGGAPTPLATGAFAVGPAAVANGEVYFVVSLSAGVELVKVSIDGGAPATTITALPSDCGSPDSLGLFVNNLAVVSGSAYLECSGEMLRVDIGGGYTSIIAPAHFGAVLATDAGVYWTDLGPPEDGGARLHGMVMGSALDGSNVFTIASGQDFEGALGGCPLATDTASVYWAANGKILRATP